MNKPIAIITPPSQLELPDFRELWEARDLLFFLVKRDLKVRFQQTIIGVLWIALQPIIQMLVFYFILGVLVRVPTNNVPYPVFFLSGYVSWQFFSQVVNASAFSLLGNVSVISKSYFPRLALPISSTLGALIDFAVSFLLLLVLLLLNHFPLTSRFLLLPVLLTITLFFSSGIGLLFGALMVIFRDTKNLLGFILMIWMYLTPIMYPITLAPEKYWIIFRLNPMTSLVEAFRWMCIGGETLPPATHLLVSFFVGLVLWLLGAVAFRAMENRIADVM